MNEQMNKRLALKDLTYGTLGMSNFGKSQH